MIKECKKCGENKSLDSFYVDNSKKNNISSYCKLCVLEKQKTYYHYKKGNIVLKEKRCSTCGITKNTTEFPKKANGKYGVASICLVCQRNWMSEYYKTPGAKIKQRTRDAKKFLKNIESLSEKEKRRRYNKNLSLKHLYGITLSEYEGMLIEQKFKCAICGTKVSEIPYNDHSTKRKDTLYVDHNHKTGEIRGLLCGSCNGGIGQLGDSISILRKAIKYLRRNTC